MVNSRTTEKTKIKFALYNHISIETAGHSTTDVFFLFTSVVHISFLESTIVQLNMEVCDTTRVTQNTYWER